MVVLTNGGERQDRRTGHRFGAHRLARFPRQPSGEITTDDQGSAHFPVNAGSVSVWVPAASL